MGARATRLRFRPLRWIRQRQAGGLDLAGTKVVMTGTFAEHGSNPWRVTLYLDDQASEAQREALTQLFLGRAGGTIQKNFAVHIVEVHAIRHARIELDHTPNAERMDVPPYLVVRTLESAAEPGAREPRHPRPRPPRSRDPRGIFRYSDPPFDWEFKGKCGFATDFAYSVQLTSANVPRGSRGLLLGLGGELLAVLLDHLFLLLLRHDGVPGKLHRERALALRRRAQIGRVPEHGVERHLAGDADAVAGDRLQDHAAPLVDLTDDRALELGGSVDLDLHDGLQDGRLGLRVGLAEAHERGGLERHFGRVDRVGSAVVDRAPDADDREADQRALAHAFLEALVARRDELAGNRAAGDVVDELVGLLDRVRRERLDVAHDLRVLAGATGLLLVGVVELRSPGDRLAVGDLRLARDHVAVVLAPHALHVDVEVELAHAADDGLLRLLVLVHAERRVFLREAVERLGEVRFRRAVLRRDRERDDGRRHVHRRERPVDLAVGERLARAGLDAVERDDVAGLGEGNLLAVVRVHAEHARDAHLAHLVARVEDGVAGRDRALVDAEVRELPVLVLLQLERQADERLRRVGLDHDLLFAFVLVVRLVDDLGRTREVVHDAVEQELNALVLDRRAAHHRGHLEGQRRATDRGAELVDRDRLLVDELLGEHVVDVGDVVDDLLASFGRGLRVLGGDLLLANGLAVLAVEEERLADDGVDDALEV